MLFSQLVLFDLPLWLHYIVMLAFVFITSMLSAYGLRGSMVAFGGLYAIVASYGIHGLGLGITESMAYVFMGGIIYITLSGITHFIYQNHHVHSILADCVELTAEYFGKLEAQIWDNKDSDLLKLESKLIFNHEILRSALLNKQGRLMSSNKTRRQYLIFRELIDLYETTLAAHHDLDQARDFFNGNDPLLQPYREFTKLLIVELGKFNEALRHNEEFVINPMLETKLLEAEENIDALLRQASSNVQETALILRNIVEMKKKQLTTLNIINKHYHNIVFSDQIVPHRDAKFVTMQDYSLKILLSNLNLQSSIFRHSVRLCVAIAVCFLLQDLISSDNTSWIIATTIVVLRPNYGLTLSRSLDRIIGTILGGIMTLGIAYFVDYKPFLIAIAFVCCVLGFSHFGKKYLQASIYITITIMLLFIVFIDNPFDLVAERVFYTFIGSILATLATYFILPVWEKEGLNEAIGKAIGSNREYLKAVNAIYESKEPINVDFKLVRKEAFVSNGNLYEAFQRYKDDPKSKRNLMSNSYAIVLLSHSTLKAIAAYSTYIQNHQTTHVSGDFRLVMDYIDAKLGAAQDTLDKGETADSLPNPSEAIERLDRYYYGLTQLRNKEIESGIAQMSYESSVKLQEGKLIVDHIKAIKNLADNTYDMCKLIHSLPS